MNWWLLRAHSENEAAYEEIVASLAKQLEKGKESLIVDHKSVLNIIDGKMDSMENNDPQTNHVDAVKTTADEPAAKPEVKVAPNSEGSMLIEIQSGEYEGSTFILDPKGKSHAWIGRSQGKKFREKGISLPKDLEVSTTHGRFELLRNQLVYVDNGSTNGSKLGDLDIEPNSPVVLESGMVITVGQTAMRVTLL